MVLKIAKETWTNNDMEVIVDSVNALRLNDKKYRKKIRS